VTKQLYKYQKLAQSIAKISAYMTDGNCELMMGRINTLNSSLNACTIDLFHFWHKAVTTRNYIVCEMIQRELGELERP